ncbi:MAG TPA: hypothetical protein VGI65_00710 [Steroidobacteraceae bacterium]
MAQAIGGFTPASQTACRAALQSYVDSLAGQAIWGTIAPWLLDALGLPRSAPFFPDFWYVACNLEPIVIPNLIIPKPPPPVPPPGGPPPPVPPPGPPPPPPPPPITGPCESGDPDADEILDLCNALQRSLACLCEQSSGGNVDKCCAQIVSVLSHIRFWIESISHTLQFLPKPPGPPPPPDLGPIVTELQALVSAIAAMSAPPPIDLTPINQNLAAIANAIAAAPAADVSGIVKALDETNVMMDVPQAIIDSLAQVGIISAQDAQLAGGGPWAYINTLLHDEWRKLNHPPSDEEMAALRADPVFGPAAAAALAGRPLPSFKEVLKATPGVIGEMLLKLFQVVMEGTFDAGKKVMQPAIRQMLAIHQDAISKMVNIKPGDESVTASTLLTEAMTFGMAAHWAAYAAELVDPGKHVGLNSSAAMLAGFAGFDELMKGIIGVEVRQAIAVPHAYKINAQARATMPNMGAALGMHARRKISDGEVQTLLGYAGLNRDWVAPTLAASYRPIQPRALATAIQDTPFPRDQMQEILEDNAYSPEHVTFFLDLLEYNSTKNVRNAYISEAIAAYKAGVMPDAELDDILTAVGWSDQAKQFVRSRALLQRRVTLAAAAEKQIVPQVQNGTLSVEQGLQQLEAAGVQPWYAELETTLAGVRATIAAAKKELAAEARLTLQRQHAGQRTAIADYQAGVLDDAALAAALLALGIDPLIAASVVATQSATRAGRMRLVYGQLLSPHDAKVLEERVAAIAQQVKDQLIDFAQARTQLQGLQVDAPEINALLARWAALLKKSAGAAQLISPITG